MNEREFVRRTVSLEDRQYLKVPFAEKDVAKDLACVWDPARRLWWCAPTNDRARSLWTEIPNPIGKVPIRDLNPHYSGEKNR